MLSTGRIVASGGAASNGRNPDFALVGLDTNGHLDSGFGTGGVVRTDFNNVSYDWGPGGLVIQPGDKIVVGGFTINASAPSNRLLAMARYTSSGALDSSFSGDGTFSADVGPHWDYISNLALDGTSPAVWPWTETATW